MLALSLFSVLLISYSQARAEDSNAADSKQSGLADSLFGQVAKTLVYGGASLARFNSRLLCPLLSHESEPFNDEQPTLFLFTNHENSRQAYRIYADDEINNSSLEEANFDASQLTYIFVHGWLGGIHNEFWLTEAKDAALSASSAPTSTSGENTWSRSNRGDSMRLKANVIVVEWSDFAMGSLYTATQNSHKVSKRLANLLQQLSAVSGLKPELMHCLGHSIGAHICGKAARQAFPWGGPRMGRITGLDPGGFCYELNVRHESAYLGLRPSDALVVDAYYTNRTPFGNKYQIGQYNVRVNNGFFQHPCSVWRNPEVASSYFRAAVGFFLGNIGHNDVLTCDHYFATKFAGQLMKSSGCSFVAYSCNSYNDFLRGRCGLCESSNQCYSMDFEYQRANGSVKHALEWTQSYSNYYVDQSLDGEFAPSPPGGVGYADRKVYYLRVAGDKNLCSKTFRLRLRLNDDLVDLRSFKSSWLGLSLLDSRGRRLKVKRAIGDHEEAPSELIDLYGPWPAADAHGGVDEATLSALFEFAEEQRETPEAVEVTYDNRLSRRQDPLANPVEFVQLDYLSSMDAEIRSRMSRRFDGDQVKLVFGHLEF